MTLNQMHAFKSPGPDGFQGVFFRRYWKMVGKDISNLVIHAFETGTFNSCIAETLIALIPKVDVPDSFNEFRPISLCKTALGTGKSLQNRQIRLKPTV